MENKKPVIKYGEDPVAKFGFFKWIWEKIQGNKQVASDVSNEETSHTPEPQKTNVNVNGVTQTPTVRSVFVPAKNNFVSFLKKTLKINNIWVLILIISAAILIVFYIWFYNPSIKNERDRLKAENKELQKQRDLVADSLRTLEVSFNELHIQDSLKTAQLAQIDEDISIIKQSVFNSSTKLNQIKGGLNDINNQIEKNKNNPGKVGDSLLNSLKYHVNQKY